MANIKIVEHVVQELPSERPLVTGHKYKVQQENGDLLEYLVDSNGEPKFVRGITNDQNTRLERLSSEQISKVESITTGDINKLKQDYTKAEIDTKIEDLGNLSTASKISLNGRTALPVPSPVENGWVELSQGVTYTQTGGADIVGIEGHRSIAEWNNENGEWVLVDMGELPGVSESRVRDLEEIINQTEVYGEINDLQYGSPQTANRVRVFTKPFTDDGRIVRTSFFYRGVQVMEPVTIIVYQKTGEGDMVVGSELSEVFSKNLIPTTAEINSFETDIEIKKGQYIGYFWSVNGIGHVTPVAATETQIYGAGNRISGTTTIDAVVTNSSLQLQIEVVYKGTNRIDVIDDKLDSLESSVIIVAKESNDLPAPQYNKLALIPNPQEGLVWSDGSVWYWTKDNVSVDINWNRLNWLAKTDGWTAFYNFTQKNIATVNGDNYILGLEDSLGNYPRLTATGDKKAIFGSIGQISTVQLDGTSGFSPSSLNMRQTPCFVVVVFKSDGSTGSQFIIDSMTNNDNNRLAVYVNNGELSEFKSGDRKIGAIDTNAHVLGIQYSPNGGDIYIDGTIIKQTPSIVSNPNYFPVKIGEDNDGGRKFKGEIAAVLFYEGIPERYKIKRMFKLIGELSGIEIDDQYNITASSYHTLLIEDEDDKGGLNSNNTYNIASLTKLMTLLVSSDYIEDFDEVVTIVNSDISSPQLDYFIQEEDEVTYKDLFAAAMVVSDNHAPTALARLIGYKINPSAESDAAAKSSFIVKMNEYATQLGMVNSNYTAPFTNCMSSALDQAKLIKHIHNTTDSIKSVWGLLSYTMNIQGGNARTYNIDSSVPVSARELIPEFIGGKTGTVSYMGSFGFVWKSAINDNLYATCVLESKPHTNRFNDSRTVIDMIYEA